MSLINQMLKDLEARRGIAAGDRVLDALPAQGGAQARGGRVALPWLLGSAGVIVVLLVWVAYLLWFRAPVPAMTEQVKVRTHTAGPVSSAGGAGAARPEAGAKGPTPVPVVPAPMTSAARVQTGGDSGTRDTTVRSGTPNTRSPAPVRTHGKTTATGARPPAAQAAGSEVSAAAGTTTQTPRTADRQRASSPVSPEVSTAPTSPALASAPAPAHTRRSVSSPSVPRAGDAGQMHKRQRPLTPTQQAEQSYQRGLDALRAGRAAQGERLLRQALQYDPDYVAARDVLAGMLLRAGRLVEAGETLREGLRRTPDHRLFAQLYARVLLAQGQAAEAVHVLEQHRPAAGQALDYDALLAALYQRTARYQQAIGLYRRLVAARPMRGAWWLGLGLALEGAGQRGPASEAYKKARETGTLDPASLAYVKQRLAALDGR